MPMLSSPVEASPPLWSPSDYQDLLSVAEDAASRYLAWSLQETRSGALPVDSPQGATTLERVDATGAATSKIEIMVIDEFTKSAMDYLTGSQTSHGEETSWLVDRFSSATSVEVAPITFRGFTGFADWLNQLAASGEAPKVINLSLGMDAGTLLSGRLKILKASFNARYGSDSNAWSATAVDEFKRNLQDLAQSCKTDFTANYGNTAEEMKVALTNLVEAGTTVTIAAGNAGEVKALFDQYGLTLPSDFFDGTYPSELPPGVIVVGASTGDTASDTAATFSSPMNGVDVAADGTQVPINDYGELGDGTSYSAPEIAGLVGDMVAIDPTLTPAEIEATLKAAVAPVAGKEAYLGAGIVDRSSALDLVRAGKAHQLLTDSGGVAPATDAPPTDTATSVASALEAAGMTASDAAIYAPTLTDLELDLANNRPDSPADSPSFWDILKKKLSEGLPAGNAVTWAQFSGLVSDTELSDPEFMKDLVDAAPNGYGATKWDCIKYARANKLTMILNTPSNQEALALSLEDVSKLLIIDSSAIKELYQAGRSLADIARKPPT